MADEDRNSTDGGTAGTGDTEVLPERETDAGGEGQGDDLANALGGGGSATGAGMTGAGAATGDASAMRSEGGGAAGAAGLGGTDAGSPGGMGGVGASGGTGTGRPPGGVSPLPPEEQER
jgi:hypothetical protein